MSSRRPSLRAVTIGAMLVAMSVTTILAYVLYDGASSRTASNNRTNLQVAQISRYEDAQTAFASAYANLTLYYLLRQSSYADEFEIARAQVERSLDNARSAAPALGDDEVARAGALAAEFTSVVASQEGALRGIQQGDLFDPVTLVGQNGLQVTAARFTDDIQQAVVSARSNLAVSQRVDASEQRRSRSLSFAIAGAWAALLLILGLGSLRWLVRPIEAVSAGTLTIAGGDLTARVPEAGPREVAQVGADVNRMTEALIRHSIDLNAYLARNLESRTTELEEANAALTGTEARFRTIVQNATDMVTIVDADGASIYSSPSVEKIMGYKPDDPASLNVLSLIHPDDLAQAIEYGARLVSAPDQVHDPAEIRVRRADGQYRYLEMSALDLLDDPAVHGIVHTSRDVTSRHEMETALRESEARFRTLAEHSPIGIYQLSPDQKVLYLNPAALALLEADALSIAQEGPFERFFMARGHSYMPWAMRLHAPMTATHETATADTPRMPEIVSSDEVEVVGLRGTKRSLLVAGAPVTGSDGVVHSLVGTMIDITERKSTEDALRADEEKFRLLFASNPHPMWVYDVETLAFLEVNSAAVGSYGYGRTEFLRMKITDIRADDDELLPVAPMRVSPASEAEEWRHRTIGGRIIDVEITSHPFQFESHDAMLVVALDITERNRVIRALADSEERFRSLVQNACDMITVIRADTTVIYQSPSCEVILGYDATGLVGRMLSEIVHAEDSDRLLAFLALATTKPATATTFEARLRHFDETWRTFEIVGSDHTADPAVGGFVLNTRDISERKVLEQQLRDQAFQDALTGLANRARFMDRLEHALERSVRGTDSVAVLFIDLDNFKNVNDTLGHAAGDNVLIQVGQRVQNCLRTGDTVARLGGDEFAVLIEDIATSEEAERLASRVVDEIGKVFTLADGSEVIIGASVGVSFINEQDGTRDLVQDADVAMYIAKTRGKSRYEVYNADMHQAMAQKLELVADLQHALEKPELFLEYQPTFRLATGALTGVEALVRWQHPRRGRVMPAEFIARAEESGLILSLGRWVLSTACRQARQWQIRYGDDFGSMSVNISVRQLQQPTFVDEVADILRETGVDPSRIVLEVTESVMMQEVDTTIPVLDSLKRLGVRLAIDDFGTGYSSLSYLARYPFDILKIDKSFIDGIDEPGNQLELIRAIIEIAKVLELEVVAEGIEREEQATQLRNLNCDVAQGFLFSHPVSASAIAEMLDRLREDLAA